MTTRKRKQEAEEELQALPSDESEEEEEYVSRHQPDLIRSPNSSRPRHYTLPSTFHHFTYPRLVAH